MVNLFANIAHDSYVMLYIYLRAMSEQGFVDLYYCTRTTQNNWIRKQFCGANIPATTGTHQCSTSQISAFACRLLSPVLPWPIDAVHEPMCKVGALIVRRMIHSLWTLFYDTLDSAKQSHHILLLAKSIA